MLKKYLVFADGHRCLLADLTYDEFVLSSFYESGGSDLEYERYKRERSMHELDEFNEDALVGAQVVVEV